MDEHAVGNTAFTKDTHLMHKVLFVVSYLTSLVDPINDMIRCPRLICSEVKVLVKARLYAGKWMITYYH